MTTPQIDYKSHNRDPTTQRIESSNKENELIAGTESKFQ